MIHKKFYYILILIVILSIILIGCKDPEEALREIKMVKVENIDFSKLKEGQYRGKYQFDVIKVEVLVNVKGQRIENIEILKHRNLKGRKAEVLPKRVLEEQTLNVDIISGATFSSKVILKAIENALKKAVK